MVAACIAFYIFTKAAADLFENISFPFISDPAGHIRNPLIIVAACYTFLFFITAPTGFMEKYSVNFRTDLAAEINASS